jgi:hypothetical protein
LGVPNDVSGALDVAGWMRPQPAAKLPLLARRVLACRDGSQPSRTLGARAACRDMALTLTCTDESGRPGQELQASGLQMPE